MTLCRIIALVASALALTGVRIECKVRSCGPTFPSLSAGNCGATPCTPPTQTPDDAIVAAPAVATAILSNAPFPRDAAFGVARASMPASYPYGYRTSGVSPPRAA